MISVVRLRNLPISKNLGQRQSQSGAPMKVLIGAEGPPKVHDLQIVSKTVVDGTSGDCARSTKILHIRKEAIDLTAAASIYSEQRHRSPHHSTSSSLLSPIISGASSLVISRKSSCKSSVFII